MSLNGYFRVELKPTTCDDHRLTQMCCYDREFYICESSLIYHHNIKIYTREKTCEFTQEQQTYITSVLNS